MRLFTLLVLSLAPAYSFAGGKAMDCGECRSTYGDLASCEPICGGKAVEGVKSKELYSALQAVSSNACSGSSCASAVKDLNCAFPNEADDPSPTSCTFKSSDGKTVEVEGARAKRITRAVKALGGPSYDPSCGAGTCHYRDAQDVNCAENRDAGNKKAKLSYSCKVMTALSEAPLGGARKARAAAHNAPISSGAAEEGTDAR